MEQIKNSEKYRFIDDLTSDVMFEAYGKDLKELFENAAGAMFTVICETRDVEADEFRDVEVTGKNAEELMMNWLTELIAMVDIEEMFFSRFEISEINEKDLKARVFGESTSREKGGTVVKAVTYHKYSIKKDKKGYSVSIVLDI